MLEKHHRYYGYCHWSERMRIWKREWTLSRIIASARALTARAYERSFVTTPRTEVKVKGRTKPGVGLLVIINCLKMSDPCSFSAPSECECTHINWFVNVLFEKHILDCRAELEFEVKKNNVEKLVSMALVFDCALMIIRSFCPQRRKIIIIIKFKIILRCLFSNCR